MRHFDYFRPQSLDNLWNLKEKHPDAMFIAGGTDLMVQIKNREIFPPALISLRSIPQLADVEMGEETRIGALKTISAIIHHPSLGKEYPLLIEAAKKLGSVQIRNVATIGGNLCNCSPCADMATPLLVLEAKVRLQSARISREIPIHQLFIGPGESCLASDEILTHILLDPPHKKAKGIFLKKGRVKMDLAVANVAILLEMEGEKCRKVRIAVGSVAPTPLRLLNVEELLEGTTFNKKVLREAQRLAADSVFPITDIRASEEYRRQIIGVYVKRGLETIMG